jgi:hypothetical protein
MKFRLTHEGLFHERRPVGVDHDGANVLGVHDFPMWEVADRELERRAAGQVLLVQSLLDLGCEVVRVVLRESASMPCMSRPAGVLADTWKALTPTPQARLQTHGVRQLLPTRVVMPDDARPDTTPPAKFGLRSIKSLISD